MATRSGYGRPRPAAVAGAAARDLRGRGRRRAGARGPGCSVSPAPRTCARCCPGWTVATRRRSLAFAVYLHRLRLSIAAMAGGTVRSGRSRVHRQAWARRPRRSGRARWPGWSTSAWRSTPARTRPPAATRTSPRPARRRPSRSSPPGRTWRSPRRCGARWAEGVRERRGGPAGRHHGPLRQPPRRCPPPIPSVARPGWAEWRGPVGGPHHSWGECLLLGVRAERHGHGPGVAAPPDRERDLVAGGVRPDRGDQLGRAGDDPAVDLRRPRRRPCRPAAAAGAAGLDRGDRRAGPGVCCWPLPPVCTPRKACIALPVVISCWATRLRGVRRDREPDADVADALAWPPSPPELAVAIDWLMPTTRPARSTSGPPELPGLIAASVCSASITALLSEPPVVGRCRALTMPSVTVPFRPSGEPTATTVWPIFTASESANVAGCQPGDVAP